MKKLFHCIGSKQIGLLGLLLVLSGCGKFPFTLENGGKPIRKLCPLIAVSSLVVNVQAQDPSASLEGLQIIITKGSFEQITEVHNGTQHIYENGDEVAGFSSPISNNEAQAVIWQLSGTFQVRVTHPTLSAGPAKTVVVQSGDCAPIGESVSFELH